MAGVTRVVGLNATAGTLYSVNAKAYLVTIQNASNSNIDLRAEDDAVDEAVEMIVKELNPLMYLVTNSAAGTIHVVMDERSNAADKVNNSKPSSLKELEKRFEISDPNIAPMEPPAIITP